MRYGRYDLIKKISAGGMGEVFRAKATGVEGFEKPIALKRIYPHLSDDETYRRLFVQEANVTAKMSHPNIVQVFDLGDLDGQLYIAMELVSGFDLGDFFEHLFREAEVMPPEQAAVVAFDVLEALDFAHNFKDEAGAPLGIIHRDVSPQNILIQRQNGFAKLCDFGVMQATAIVQDTLVGKMVGKLYYMSPEQARGWTVDARSDLYSLGVILYEAVTGQNPFSAFDPEESLRLVLERPAAPVAQLQPDLPPAVAAIIDRALKHDPAERFQSAEAFRDAIEDFLSSCDPRAARRGLLDLVSALEETTVVTDLPVEPGPEHIAGGTDRWTELVTKVAAPEAQAVASEPTVRDSAEPTVSGAREPLARDSQEPTVSGAREPLARDSQEPTVPSVLEPTVREAVGEAAEPTAITTQVIDRSFSRRTQPTPGHQMDPHEPTGKWSLETPQSFADMERTPDLPLRAPVRSPNNVVVWIAMLLALVVVAGLGAVLWLGQRATRATTQPAPVVTTGGQGLDTPGSPDAASDDRSRDSDASNAGAASSVPAEGLSKPEVVFGDQGVDSKAGGSRKAKGSARVTTGRRKAVGYLSLHARPWARVAIDGVPLKQTTPILQHPLRPGRHTVTVTAPSGDQRTIIVNIAKGKTVTKIVKLN